MSVETETGVRAWTEYYLVDVSADEVSFLDGQLIVAFHEEDPARMPDILVTAPALPPIPAVGTKLALQLSRPDRAGVAFAQAQVLGTTPMTHGYLEVRFGFSPAKALAVCRALDITTDA